MRSTRNYNGFSSRPPGRARTSASWAGLLSSIRRRYPAQSSDTRMRLSESSVCSMVFCPISRGLWAVSLLLLIFLSSRESNIFIPVPILCLHVSIYRWNDIAVTRLITEEPELRNQYPAFFACVSSYTSREQPDIDITLHRWHAKLGERPAVQKIQADKAAASA